MSRRKNTQNIDRKTNKPNPKRTEGITPDVKLVRGNEIRRDDDVIRTPTRSIYDIDWKIEGISSHKLEYIAYKYNFFYKGHCAVIDMYGSTR